MFRLPDGFQLFLFFISLVRAEKRLTARSEIGFVQMDRRRIMLDVQRLAVVKCNRSRVESLYEQTNHRKGNLLIVKGRKSVTTARKVCSRLLPFAVEYALTSDYVVSCQ